MPSLAYAFRYNEQRADDAVLSRPKKGLGREPPLDASVGSNLE